MTLEQVIGFVLALAVMSVGILGSILPALPSTPIVLAAAIGHRLYFKEFGASYTVLVLMTLLMLLSLLLDFLASSFGARRMGATWRGGLGAIIGAIVGIFFSLPGVLLGPFIGALVFELAGRRELKDAFRAGIGAAIGVVLGAIGKLGCCVAMIALFVVSVLNHSGELAVQAMAVLERFC